MSDVIVKTVQTEGFRGLYKGVLPNLLKLAPAAGISWFVFEEVKRVLGVDPRS
jgi:solute carrier family 25 (mitochondrial phosphate transporter), member 23/24/25/41